MSKCKTFAVLSFFYKLVDNLVSQYESKEAFTAGRPKAALLYWFSGDFRCGALLFMVILVIYKYKNR